MFKGSENALPLIFFALTLARGADKAGKSWIAVCVRLQSRSGYSRHLFFSNVERMSILKHRSSFQDHNANPLNLEVLEDRMMLSSVEIFAAGATGQENLELLIDGQVVQTFFNVGGDASSGDFVRFTFDADPAATHGDIGIRFSNDAFDPSIGLDRNLFVDRIAVRGVSVEAEDPSTFSTGIYRDGGLTGPGFLQTDVLNINGTLTFADPVSSGAGDLIQFDALGTTGEEIVDLLVNGQVVQTFGLFDPGLTQTFNFQSADPNISIEDVRLEFVNDLFDPDRGIDRNVQVFEFRVIDGDTGEVQKAKTTDANVLNSGIFVDGGITEGFGAGGFLAGNFDGNAFVEISGGGGTNSSGDRIEFDALGTTGEEFVDVLVNGQAVAFFGLDNPGVTQTFSFTSDDPNISIEDVRLEFVNDLFDPSRGIDRNVQIFEFRVIDGDTGAVQKAKTTDANVLSSGIFANGALTQGFGAGGFLAGDFQGNGFVEISDVTVGDNTVGGPTAISPDPNFQVTEGSFSFQPAIGPGDRIAGVTTGNLIQVVGSDGVLLSSFGGDGSVDLDDLLNLPSGFELNITDLEFFDDGSILATGFTEELGAGTVFGQGPAAPVIAKLSPDGTLDTSFSQQGFLQGTFLQLPDNGSPVEAVIDSLGRVVVFGANNNNPDPTDNLNYVVSRLNVDGTLDSTFGNNGNVFISGSSFPNSDSPFPSGTPLGVDVLDNNNIIFAFSFLGFTDVGPAQSVVVGRVLPDGTIDPGFGDNGFFVSNLGADASPPLFQLTPSGAPAIVFDSSNNVSTLLRVTPAGDLFEEVLLPVNSEVLSEGTDSSVSIRPTDLAVDQFGNLVLTSFRSVSAFGSLPNVIQRILPSGELDTEFGLDGGAILGFTGATDIIFDSQNRLVVVGEDRTRFEFV